MAKIRRGFVEVEELQLHYREAGRDGGTPLMVLAQCPGSSSEWIPAIQAFGESRRTIGLDFPGLGDSEALPYAPMMADYARVIAGAIDAWDSVSGQLTVGARTFAVGTMVAVAGLARGRHVLMSGEQADRHAPHIVTRLIARGGPHRESGTRVSRGRGRARRRDPSCRLCASDARDTAGGAPASEEAKSPPGMGKPLCGDDETRRARFRAQEAD